jgi:hypothetical protein
MAIQRRLSEGELTKRLKGACIMRWQPDDHAILAAYIFGYERPDIAEGLDIPLRTVSRHVKRIVLDIFQAIDVRPNDRFLSQWWGYHATCCTVLSHKLASSGHILTRNG